jgi:cytochrome b561
MLALLLIALHVLAALYHQYVVKDGLIARMMRAGG